jgi:hypothetical protein
LSSLPLPVLVVEVDDGVVARRQIGEHEARRPVAALPASPLRRNVRCR